VVGCAGSPVRGPLCPLGDDGVRASGRLNRRRHGVPKQGDKSPLVQRQCSGTHGKTDSCQVAVSVQAATSTLHLPLDMDLYLRESWDDERARSRAAHVPDDVHRPKWRIALPLIERNVMAGVPPGLMLTDSGYGDIGEFRDGVSRSGLRLCGRRPGSHAQRHRARRRTGNERHECRDGLRGPRRARLSEDDQAHGQSSGTEP
jgi:SRSO17 transposase